MNTKTMSLQITPEITIPDAEIELVGIRAQGAGGQNVNKVSSAIHLRFDIKKSSLPQAYKIRLLHAQDYRITTEGVLIIKAQRYRSQEQNKEDALSRLARMIRKINTIRKHRKKTKPSKQSVQNRLDHKKRHGKIKRLRQVPTSL